VQPLSLRLLFAKPQKAAAEPQPLSPVYVQQLPLRLLSGTLKLLLLPDEIITVPGAPAGGICAGYLDHQKAVEFLGGFPGPFMPPYMQQDW